jgi:hypothetical protein
MPLSHATVLYVIHYLLQVDVESPPVCRGAIKLSTELSSVFPIMGYNRQRVLSTTAQRALLNSNPFTLQ